MEVDYVKECTKEEYIDPRKFYRGMDLGWAAIEQNLDVQRQISDEIITDVFLTDPLVNKNTPQVVLVNAHAGAGKSVILRRIAWDAAYVYDCICLYLRHHGKIDWLALQELAGLCTKRIFLFIDNAADHTQELQQLVEKIGPEGGQITVLIAERTNEWNMVGEDYQNLVSRTYDISYLTEHEIDSLLALLKKHKALGTIEHCSIEEQREAFKKKAGRQILVALHEATLGKPFEEIVVDEYKNIQPIEAQSMYLSVCVLNRLNVDVRAGIISRIHGIRFADFKLKFFFPLEEVIQTKYDPVVRDFVYGARHPLIADMVFINVLTNQDERFDAYIKCFKALNIDYSSDKSAFQQMIRAHSLCDLFSNPDLIKAVFKAAQLMSVGDPFVLQQMAIFEMHHKTGNLDLAAELLLKAQSQAPYSKTIKHSLSEIHLRLADQARTELQHKKNLAEAESIARSLIKMGTGDSHSYHTLCKIGLRRIQAVLDVKDEEFSRTTFEQLVKSIEKDLSDGLQNFPNDPFLLDSESRLGTLLVDSRRALSALEKAFEANHRNSWFAIRLSRAYQMQDNIGRAKDVLKKGLDANNNSHELHYYYAKLLLSTEQSNSEEIRYHLRRSFSTGDANYDAQILYARELYLSGQLDESKVIFDSLHHVRLSPDNINQIRYPLEKESQGYIAKIETTYCFILRDGVADWIFAHRNNVDQELWDNLARDSRVKFKIGFTMKGPSAFDVRKLEVK
jgi:tetratricopeptide (TPR) repeat protein